jgi:hypothetical protein
MDSNKITIAALLFIILIVAINFALYGIARGAAKGGDSRWMNALKDSLSKPMDSSANKSMDELRKQVEELKKKENDE